MEGRSMRLMSAILALTLSGVAEPAALMAQEAAPAQQSLPDQQASPDAQQPAATSDRQEQEDKASQEMINRNHLPDNATPLQPPAAQQSATQTSQPPAPPVVQPSGTAAAQAGKISGNAASRPAGAAIAPAKQRQVRSVLIKMGVIAGAGVALGTVTALTKASGSKPPGAK
ncbi:MAG TPA: hypothetical protein VGV15_03800 [Terriglobales bacterium]|nr:hypothetical protein [Terriglobales bacterium]